jgi:hypothetical protein
LPGNAEHFFQPNGDSPIPTEQKAERIAELTARIPELEIHHEALIMAATARGVEVLRRPNALPPFDRIRLRSLTPTPAAVYVNELDAGGLLRTVVAAVIAKSSGPLHLMSARASNASGKIPGGRDASTGGEISTYHKTFALPSVEFIP